MPTEVAEAIKLCLHMHTKRTLSVNGTARLVRMFEVLAALREPPTLSKLRSWGFKDAKRLVKACGFMLHITETTEVTRAARMRTPLVLHSRSGRGFDRGYDAACRQVHAFHKLLFKFLADRRQAGEFSASPRSGHRSLARMLLANIQNENAPTTECVLLIPSVAQPTPRAFRRFCCPFGGCGMQLAAF